MSKKYFIPIFGGIDYRLSKLFSLEEDLTTDYHGSIDISVCEKTEPDEIIASMITGKPPQEHGILGSMHYTNPLVRKVEEILPEWGEMYRRKIYTNKGWDFCRRRRYIESEIETSTVFDQNICARPLFLPSYNPEIQWLIFRNTIRANEYPGLGEKESEKLIEKNFQWRKKVLEKELKRDYDLLMIHFQYIDSIQHVYYENNWDMEKVRKAYDRIGSYCNELIKSASSNGFDETIILSEYGVPSRTDSGDSHHRTPFYPSTTPLSGKSINVENILNQIELL
ncbi:alkaline phosphatase family protein [Halorubrum sp. AS12]|uniref:alkaline phosphatase family protein n=1 Tax=Halorubrum sp. AS12 TaxID=3409687 RepID=UPI003DA76B51